MHRYEAYNMKTHVAQVIFMGVILSVGTSTVSSSQPRLMFSTRTRSSSNNSNILDLLQYHPNNSYCSSKIEQRSSQSRHKLIGKNSIDDNYNDIFGACDEISDCFHLDDDYCSYNDNDDEERPFAFHANIEENIQITSPPSSLLSFVKKKRMVFLQNAITKATHGCYQICPSVMYSSSINRNANTSAGASASAFRDFFDGMANDKDVRFSSLLRLRKPKTDSSTSTLAPPPSTTTIQEREDQEKVAEEEIIQEPSQRILSGIIKPLIPTSIWNSLTGNEFYYPSTLSNLIQTGIRITTTMATTTASGEDESNDGGNAITILDEEEQTDGDYINWKPADSKTKKLLAANNKDSREVPDALLKEDQVLVWIGKFMTKKNNKNDEGYGASLPLIKTISVIPLSPKKFAELLMDSSKVPLYNKMSLGRKDVVVFQQGVDTETDTIGESGTSTSMLRGGSGGSSFPLDGEAKIVRNVTKPPLSKKLMEFVTLMYARKLKENDNISPGYLGGGTSTSDGDDGSYIVVTRAVSGGHWGVGGGKASNAKSDSNDDDDDDKEEMTRSEILLGVNLLRSIPGEPDKTEVTAVTHVYSPSVPKMLAGSVGVKGAIDFVKDIRALCG